MMDAILPMCVKIRRCGDVEMWRHENGERNLADLHQDTQSWRYGGVECEFPHVCADGQEMPAHKSCESTSR